ncbi:MAG: DUF5107 domain-containing protein [candidate division KSB1 bacterium]|nr:DUF5107 domain-containing protein [candidate division KSB1 bacterium]
MTRAFLMILILIIPLSLPAAVSMRDTTIVWHTFDYQLTDDNMMESWSDTPYDTVSRTFQGLVLENDYLRVTLVPGYGGRILSMIYKPTGHEQLYQNPVGTPYGIGEDWFYYKWLMVYGGIFPTLPEPEHGKAWLLPWTAEVIAQTKDSVSVRMSWRDSVALDDINTGKWKYGVTGLTCDFTVTLVSGHSSLKADVIVSNDAAIELDYEYWTCLTLAPGSDPQTPRCTRGAELVIPASKVKIPPWYPDIAGQEESIAGERNMYTFNVLRDWENWVNDGIAYPWDDPNADYWGVINQDNGEGLIRVADNRVTPGIKIWAWGYPASQDIDPFAQPQVSRRPYIRLWAGHSREFFEPAQIGQTTQKQWTELYAPTVGLAGVSHANLHFIADLKLTEESEAALIELMFVPADLESDCDVALEITGDHPQALQTEHITPDPVNGNRIVAELPADQTWSVNDSVRFVLSSAGRALAGTCSLHEWSTRVETEEQIVRGHKLYQNYPNPFNAATTIEYRIASDAHVRITVLNMLGETVETLVNRQQHAGLHSIQWTADAASGIYYYKLDVRTNTGQFTDLGKMVHVK